MPQGYWGGFIGGRALKIIKLSLLFRAYDFLYDYRKEAGKTFWEEFEQRIRQKFGDLAVESKGSFHKILYVPSEMDTEQADQEVRSVISEIVPDQNIYIFIAAEPTEKDIARLKANDTGCITQKEWFSGAASNDAHPAATAKKEQKAEPAQTEQSVTEEPKKTTEAVQQEASSDPKKGDEEEPLTLAAEMEKIRVLREGLLKEVKGQRHAIEQFVQTIFEADAFARNNPKRKGPVASFLFLGPSGVGKTFLSKLCGELIGRKTKVFDMSEFSDNLANGKFNGEFDSPALVTAYVRENPDAILVFDEIEKAHINTIYQFLQILEEGRMQDMKVKREVSFRDNIVIATTNAGRSLYEDTTVCNLSTLPRKVILEGLREDVNDVTGKQVFPECIITRFANGNIILFNHLEPYALMEIIKKEIKTQIELFNSSFHIEVEYSPEALASLVLYNAGGVSDARTLRGLARSMVVKELQDIIQQTYQRSGDAIDQLKRIRFYIEPEGNGEEVENLFSNHQDSHVLVFADEIITDGIAQTQIPNVVFYPNSDIDAAKRAARGVIDYVLIDPACGMREMKYVPNDIEDIRSDGMDLFNYFQEYHADIPVYILDTRSRGESTFGTLLSRGARGVLAYDLDNRDVFISGMNTISYSALINNSVFTLGRSGKLLNYNCSQYSLDEETAVVTFDKFSLGLAPKTSDTADFVVRDSVNGITFKDVIGCKSAKKVLQEFCDYVEDPRKHILAGKKVPRGILLYGPPGTGKTMLAKAMANEVKAAFFQTSATTFFDSLVGQSEKNVRELFAKARRYAPAVIFIDEVDAIGRRRGGTFGSSHNEDVLNTFLAQMDGFVTDEKRPVFIIAATNFDVSGTEGRVLDPAFVRRFDSRIFMDLPDTEEREEFLRMALNKHGVSFGENQEKIIHNVAVRTTGCSGADLTNIVELFLRKVADGTPTGAILLDAVDEFRYGDIHEYDPEELRQTACHESGHALINRLLTKTPSYLTIVARGQFGGYMAHDIDEKKLTETYQELLDRVCCALGGRAAEIVIYGDKKGYNTGASSDIRQAKNIVTYALKDLGMGSRFFITRFYDEAEAVIHEQFDRAVKIIEEHREILLKLTDLLLANKSLDQTQLDAFFDENLREAAQE